MRGGTPDVSTDALHGVDADPGSRLGVGFRTQVWNGKPNADLEERVAELETINGTMDRLTQGQPIDEQRAKAASPDCVASLDFIGVLRTLKDTEKDVMWDYGARLLWRPSRQLYLSMEALRRNGPDATEASGTSRTVGMLEYRIRTDLAVYGSFGRDFEKDSGVRSLVSVMGLNIGFGSTPSVQP